MRSFETGPTGAEESLRGGEEALHSETLSACVACFRSATIGRK
jgi:hypothetical protein